MMLELLTPEEAARRLGISTRQLRDLTNEGLIKWVNIGLGKKRPTRRYTEADLSAFVEERTTICRPAGMPTGPTPLTSPYGIVDFGLTLAQLRSAKASAPDKAFDRLVALASKKNKRGRR